jgi:hypothetical protein
MWLRGKLGHATESRDTKLSRGEPRQGWAMVRRSVYRWLMENAQPSDLTRLAVVVFAALLLVVYAFLRMAGIIHGRGHRGGRPPPPLVPP